MPASRCTTTIRPSRSVVASSAKKVGLGPWPIGTLIETLGCGPIRQGKPRSVRRPSVFDDLYARAVPDLACRIARETVSLLARHASSGDQGRRDISQSTVHPHSSLSTLRINHGIPYIPQTDRKDANRFAARVTSTILAAMCDEDREYESARPTLTLYPRSASVWMVIAVRGADSPSWGRRRHEFVAHDRFPPVSVVAPARGAVHPRVGFFPTAEVGTSAGRWPFAWLSRIFRT